MSVYRYETTNTGEPYEVYSSAVLPEGIILLGYLKSVKNTDPSKYLPIQLSIVYPRKSFYPLLEISLRKLGEISSGVIPTAENSTLVENTWYIEKEMYIKELFKGTI